MPFYLRSGKALKRKTSEIIIEFQRPPHMMFHLPEPVTSPPTFSLCASNRMKAFTCASKPRSPIQTRKCARWIWTFTSIHRLTGRCYLKPISDSCSKLFGDASLFTRSDELEAAWRLVDPVLQGWRNKLLITPARHLQSGDWGPEEADQLLARNGHLWRLGCVDEPD